MIIQRLIEIKSSSQEYQGYRKLRFQLMREGYEINAKKLYRILREQGLLQEKHKNKERNFVKYRKVTPQHPLVVLEMDIKYIWIEDRNKFSYTLTIIDTFTRVLLGRYTGFHITNKEVRQLWEEVIATYFQEESILQRKLQVEVRNDNGPQFISKIVQKFFKDNYMDQVFTHPYTPQENGHIESFHAILSNRVKNRVFVSIAELEIFLEEYYIFYNEKRLHGSIAMLSPNEFWQQWSMGNIEMKLSEKKKVKFKLRIPYHQLSGNENQREHPAHSPNNNLVDHNDTELKRKRPLSLLQPSVQRSPSVASC
jgi:transposase InsO family protein